MQKLWLKNFEFHINPNTWNTAQDLVRAGAVQQLQEVEKHFWIAAVADDDQRFEVEVMITPHKVKAFTCECWVEKRRLMCPHIAATLYQIRRFLEQKSEARQNRAALPSPEKPGRLTVQAALDTASADQLAEFVRMYAQKDRDFALALKTWFAGQLKGPENPYLLLFDTALPRHAYTRALRDPELRRLRKTLDNLDAQIALSFSQANGFAVFQIASAVLEKITPLLARLDEHHKAQLAQYCQNALQKILGLEEEQLSPELREKRRDFLLAFLLNNNERFPTAERFIVPFLSQAALEDRFFNQINHRFDQAPHPTPPALLHLFLSALAARDRPEAVVRVLQDYFVFPDRITAALSALAYDHRWSAVLLAGDYVLERATLNPGQTRQTEDILLNAAEKAGDQTRLMMYLRRRYRQYGSPEAFIRLKTVAGTRWPEEREKLSAVLRENDDTDKLAPLLAGEGDLDGLAALLRPGQLELLQRYESLFLPDRSAFVRDYYVAELSQYLKDHFGRQGSGFVRDNLAFLLRKNEIKLAKEIIAILVARFPDRHTLPEELAELFPKNRRPQGVQGDV